MIKKSHADLPKIVQGIHDAGEDSTVQARRKKEVEKERLWRGGRIVRLRREHGTHAGANAVFTSSAKTSNRADIRLRP